MGGVERMHHIGNDGIGRLPSQKAGLESVGNEATHAAAQQYRLNNLGLRLAVAVGHREAGRTRPLKDLALLRQRFDGRTEKLFDLFRPVNRRLNRLEQMAGESPYSIPR